MSNSSTAQPRADIKAYLSPSAISPRQKHVRTLWIGPYSSSLPGAPERKEPEISKGIGQPARVTMFLALDFIRTSFPRHVPWTAFPLVSEPWFEFKSVNASWGKRDAIFPDPGERFSEPADIFAHYDAFVIDPDQPGGSYLPSMDNLLKLAYAAEHLADRNQRVFLVADAFPDYVKPHPSDYSMIGAIREVSPSEILEWMRPYGMLMYSYRMNFAAIAMKALRAARHGCPEPYIVEHYRSMHYGGEMGREQREKHPPMRVAHRSDSNHYWLIFGKVEAAWKKFDDGLVPEGLDHPLTLQFLYALRKSGTVSAEAFLNKWDGTDHMFGALFGNGRYDRSNWRGTGKYPSLDLGFEKLGQQALLALGLVEIDHMAMTLSITDIGRRFLDYLPASCEDPDVILRWIDPNTGYFHVGSEASVEEWLTRFFRRMKTSVNGIPRNLTEIPDRITPFGRFRMGDDMLDEDED